MALNHNFFLLYLEDMCMYNHLDYRQCMLHCSHRVCREYMVKLFFLFNEYFYVKRFKYILNFNYVFHTSRSYIRLHMHTQNCPYYHLYMCHYFDIDRDLNRMARLEFSKFSNFKNNSNKSIRYLMLTCFTMSARITNSTCTRRTTHHIVITCGAIKTVIGVKIARQCWKFWEKKSFRN